MLIEHVIGMPLLRITLHVMSGDLLKWHEWPSITAPIMQVEWVTKICADAARTRWTGCTVKGIHGDVYIWRANCTERKSVVQSVMKRQKAAQNSLLRCGLGTMLNSSVVYKKPTTQIVM
jgi:hypothetical protein